MSISSIVLTGILAVFSIFVILYVIFILLSLVFRDKGSRKKEVSTPPQKLQEPEAENHEDDTHVAIISAVLSEILGKPVLVKKVYQSRNYDLEDRTTTWRKSGWKGARGWRASSGW